MNIEFYSSVEGVVDTFPVINAQEEVPAWTALARQEYLQNKERVSVFRCPGIFDLMRTGFIVRAWHDIRVDPTNNLIGYVPSADVEELLEKPPVQTHSELAKHLPKRPWSHPHIFKINTPWHVKAPCKFMMIPIPYTDQLKFESNIGILDPAVSSEINVQGYINTNQVFDIKAGTPLCQLVPITEKPYKLVVRDMDNKDRMWLKTRKYINGMSFVLNRNTIKNAYRKYLAK